jgi:hypothetical protein
LFISSFLLLLSHALRGSFVYVFHDLACYTSCISLSFNHEYFCVGNTFIPVLHMFDMFCEVFQESFCQFVTKGKKIWIDNNYLSCISYMLVFVGFC